MASFCVVVRGVKTSFNTWCLFFSFSCLCCKYEVQGSRDFFSLYLSLSITSLLEFAIVYASLFSRLHLALKSKIKLKNEIDGQNFKIISVYDQYKCNKNDRLFTTKIYTSVKSSPQACHKCVIAWQHCSASTNVIHNTSIKMLSFKKKSTRVIQKQFLSVLFSTKPLRQKLEYQLKVFPYRFENQK